MSFRAKRGILFLKLIVLILILGVCESGGGIFIRLETCLNPKSLVQSKGDQEVSSPKIRKLSVEVNQTIEELRRLLNGMGNHALLLIEKAPKDSAIFEKAQTIVSSLEEYITKRRTIWERYPDENPVQQFAQARDFAQLTGDVLKQIDPIRPDYLEIPPNLSEETTAIFNFYVSGIRRHYHDSLIKLSELDRLIEQAVSVAKRSEGPKGILESYL